MISWWVWWPSLSHSTASTGSNTWQCCLYLFSSMPRFSCLLKKANPSFSFYDIFATNFLNPFVLLYTGPPIHPTTKKLSAMACSLLLHLFPLPYPCSSTCGLGSSCQPGLCALSGSEVGERFVFLIVFGTCNILSLVDEMVFMNNSEKCLFVSCVQYLFCTFIYLDTSSDPFYGPHYLLHHVWSQVWNDFTISMILKWFSNESFYHQAIVVMAVSKAFSFLLSR